MFPDVRTTDSKARTRQIFQYFSVLTLLVYVVDPTIQFVDIAFTYLLKDQLHASASRVAMFRLLTAVPVYLAFVFGLTRDFWDPFGLRDRGFFALFGLVSAAVFTWMAVAPLSYLTLFCGVLLIMITTRFVLAAYQGLLALIGQEQLMSGRLSALWQIVSYIPSIGGAAAAGYVAQNFPPSRTFLTLAAFSLAISAIALWKPAAVFGHAYDQPLARSTTFSADLRRLLGHRPIYPAVLIMLMFQFSPGSGIVLAFHMTDALHASDAIYGFWYAIFLASFIPVMLLYAYFCKRVPFGRLLVWGTVLAVPQMLPLVFVNSATAALWLAIPIGMMGGIIWPAIYDLAIRSCPPGLQGTLMMLVAGSNALAVRGGDLIGTWIYHSSPSKGFLYTALATTAMYAAILPLILLVPRHLLRSSDGQAVIEDQAPTQS
jgi:hypothetical protein